MTTLWDRRIRHITRAVKPTRMRGVRGQLIKADVQARRGRPSRNLPADLVFESIRLNLKRGSDDPEVQAERERLDRACVHDRMLERKRKQRDAVRRRARPSVLDTKIHLGRRRRDWLRQADAPTGQPPD
jgi:hypothetical protein